MEHRSLNIEDRTLGTEHWGQNIGDVENLFHDFVEKCRITDFIVYNSVFKKLKKKKKKKKKKWLKEKKNRKKE